MMRALIGAAVVTLALAGAVVAKPVCHAPSDRGAVAQAARDLFAAAEVDDAVKIRALTTADFYAYDNGKRFDGMALFDLIKTAHAGGRRFVWTVQEPKVSIACDTAMLVYVNHGAVGDAAAMQPMTWLESDYLRYEQGRWKVAFLHSTRAAP